MVNHVQRFRLGITLIVLGLPLAVVEDLRWTRNGGLLPGLLALLGVAVVIYGAMLLKHKRSA